MTINTLDKIFCITFEFNDRIIYRKNVLVARADLLQVSGLVDEIKRCCGL